MAGDPDVALVVNAQRHDGWQSITIHQSIEELAPTFTVDYTQRWSPDGAPVAIRRYDPVEVFIGESRVLSGIVDECFEDYDASSHTVTCSGRSRTGQLADCAAIYQTGSIAGKNLEEIAALLAEPYGITVSRSEAALDVGDPIPQFQIQDGGTVFESINDVARQEGVLLLSGTDGNLVLARAATEHSGVAITAGNIKRGSLRSSGRNRYSQYILKGQAPPATKLKGAAATQLKTTITDDDVPLYRPIVIHDHQTTIERLQQRAQWERNTRAGASDVFTYDVQGWFNANGLWQVNTLVYVSDPTLGIDADLLITAVDFQRNNETGRHTRLELRARETFDVLKPPKLPKRKRQKKGSAAAALGL